MPVFEVDWVEFCDEWRFKIKSMPFPRGVINKGILLYVCAFQDEEN